jgi:hypothetical protein
MSDNLSLEGIKVIHHLVKENKDEIMSYIKSGNENGKKKAIEISEKGAKYVYAWTKVFDLFVLGRMFRKFNKMKNKVPNDICKYSVVIAGATHTTTIKKYLTEFPFNFEVIKDIDSRENCINFDEIFP